MLKKTIRRLGALAMVLAMAVSVFAVNASANNTEVLPAVSKKITKSTNTYVPTTDFTFSITAAGQSDTIGTNPGVDGVISIDPVHFEANANDIGVAEVNGTGGTIRVDATKFMHPGIYYYNVTEVNSAVSGVTYDPQTKKLAVYKYKNGTIAYMFVKEETKEDGTKELVKDNAPFANGYVNVSDLTISKTVTGDFADETKDFTFTITITGVADKTYNVYKKDKVIKTLTSGKSDTITLKHGESVVIKGLEAADTYTVVETNEDYTPSINNAGVTVNGATATGDMTIDKTSAAKTVAYTNERNASTPGGVIMTIAPYALMVVLAGAFAVVFLTRRNRAE